MKGEVFIFYGLRALRRKQTVVVAYQYIRLLNANCWAKVCSTEAGRGNAALPT